MATPSADDPRIQRMGHREFVGGLWDEVGELTARFLVDAGLRPTDNLLDIGCGALRVGVRLIVYLDAERYSGLDKERTLIAAGIREELGVDLMRRKRPEFVVSDAFDFERLRRRPEVSIAQSLFSHLTLGDIRVCLANLRRIVPPGHRLYATFNPRVDSAHMNPTQSDSWGYFTYDESELVAVGRECGYRGEPIGPWGHPRGQHMMLFVATPGTA